MISGKKTLCGVCVLALVAAVSAAEEHACGGNHAHETSELTVAKGSQALIDLKVEPAKRTVFTKRISVSGQIARDPVASSYITSPVSGVITECRVKLGEVVRKGQALCTVKGAEQSVEITAPIDGTIMSDSFRPGERVDSISAMHMVADLSQVWATFDVYEKDIAAICVGQKLAVRSVAYPKETFAGEVTFISPCLDEDSHAIKVRALVRNPGCLLKLGMFVTAEIMVEAAERYIVVPLEAVHTAGDKKIVFVKTADEKFEARDVTVDDQSSTEAAICDGVTEGELIVTGNSFLLKSEYLKSQMSAGCAD